MTGNRLASQTTQKLAISGNCAKTLDNVDSATLLGLEIDSTLSFHGHIDKICTKIASCIAVLRDICTYLPLNQRILYYNAIIRPIMTYANVIWCNCDKESLNRVLKLQKRAARVILSADYMASSVELFNKLSWIPFYEQGKIDKCCCNF